MCVFLKSTSFAFPSPWDPPWKFDLVPISSTIGQDIIPKFPFPSLPTEQYPTSPDMSANFSGNLYTDHNKLNIFKMKIHISFSSASLWPSGLFLFLFNASVNVNLSLHPSAAELLFTCIPHIQTLVYCFPLLSLQSASLSLHPILPRFWFILCLSHVLTAFLFQFTPPHYAMKSLHIGPEKSFLYFSQPLRRSRNQMKMWNSSSSFPCSTFFSLSCLLLCHNPKPLQSNFTEVTLLVISFPFSSILLNKISNYTIVKD